MTVTMDGVVFTKPTTVFRAKVEDVVAPRPELPRPDWLDAVDPHEVCCPRCVQRFAIAVELHEEAARTGRVPSLSRVAEIAGISETYAVTFRRRVFGLPVFPHKGGNAFRVPYPVTDEWRAAHGGDSVDR